MGFLNPLALLFAALYGVLVLLYLWHRRQRQVDVPSLLLWSDVPEDVARASRFLPDLLFVLQVLLLTLLIGGLAHPYLRGADSLRRPRRSIFVLDISASMQAREGRKTRFEEARAALLGRVAKLHPDDEAMVITAAAHPDVVSPFTRNHAEITQLVERLRPTDTAGELNLALALAHRAADRSDLPADIFAFTDLPRAQLDATWSEGVNLTQVGESDDNVAIQALDVRQEPFGDLRETYAEVVVRNFAHRDSHGFLTLRLSGEVLSRQGFSLPSRDARTFFVSGFPTPGILEAVLEGDDALHADDRALGWVSPPRRVTVLVVTRPSSLRAQLAAIAGATTALDFRFMEPDAYARDPRAADADVIIFHRYVPAVEPPRPRLYVLPPKDNTAFPVRGHLEQAELLDWHDAHPVLRGLPPLAPFPFARVRDMQPPEWAEVLLSGRSGEKEAPLAFAGEHEGSRVACIAFDLAQEHMLRPDKVGVLLFFLNLLHWLAPPDEGTITVRTGTVQTFTGLPLLPRRVTDPNGHVSDFPAEPSISIEPLYAGEYEIAFDGTRRRVLANLFDSVESDIGRPAAGPPPKVRRATAAEPTTASNDLSPWLYLACTALLLLEWMVAARRS